MILISLVFAVITQGGWVSIGNLQSISQVTAVLAIMAFGEAIVIATGEIDISVGSVSGIGALTFMGLAPIVGSGLALLAAVVCGILIGTLNGVFVALLGLPSLLVTLGTLFLFQGIGYAVTSGFSFAATDAVRQEFIYNAVRGGNIAGVNVAAFAGVLDAAFIGYADGSFGATMELSAIAAAVLGGCYLAGGRISLVGTLFGAFMLRGIQSFLILLAVQPQWYILVVGFIVVLASVADRMVTRFVTKH